MNPFDPVEEAGLESFPASDAPAWPGPDPVPPLALASLPYGYGDLAPVIDAETMELHHDKHHRAYLDGLNSVAARHPGLHVSSVESLLRRPMELPDGIRTTVHNMGGGHYNHTLFWESMTPRPAAPENDLRRAFDSAFGSFDRFQRVFETAGSKHFGSGWVYVVANPRLDYLLEIVTLSNQDTPFDVDRVPILACDLWEHAYYLKYRNRRADWLHAWWDVVDWQAVAARLDRARS